MTASTLVLDTATLGAALYRLGWEISSPHAWQPTKDENHDRQQRLLNLFGGNWELYERLKGLRAKTSKNHNMLNAFLVENGFEPCFREIMPDGFGVATLLDLLMEWVTTAKPQWFYDSDDKKRRAFELPVTGVQIMDVVGCLHPVVRIPTKNDIWVWLVMTNRPADELAMVERAIDLLGTAITSSNTEYAGAVIPTLEIDTTVGLSWLLGMHQNRHVIDQVFQQVKLRMNEEGARVKAATGLGGGFGGPQPLVFNRPFLGFFTQSECPVPIGVFYAEQDCWQDPAGRLGDL